MPQYKSIVVLTGAGISAESGLKTFRDSGGLWENQKIEEIATLDAFICNPEKVYAFYNQRRRQLFESHIQPNKAHFALAELQEKFQGDFVLITQNVDNLHERAGSKHIIHMHGELLKARCVYTNKIYSITEDIDNKSECECCKPSSRLRPHIVWFGEMPLQMGEISEALANCDLFISIGTSGNVYPAAGFVQQANYAGAHTVELNLEPSVGQSNFAYKKYGLASEIVPEFVSELLAA